MNRILTLWIATLCFNPWPLAYADDNSDTNALLTNLGAYLGFDLVTNFAGTPYATLLDLSTAQLIPQNLLYSIYGALPVNALSSELSQFVPSSSNNSTSSIINNQANQTFNNINYSTPNTQGTALTANPLIDQPSFQNDPTSQAILNILGTPDHTFCMNNDASAWLDSCNYLYDYSVISNLIGGTPTINHFLTYTYNQNIVPQLNSNTLIAPLLYDKGTNNNQTSSNQNNTANTESGLIASNQLQSAANFIRYATANAQLPSMPSYQDYNDTYALAISKTASVEQVAKAQNAINQFIAKLRNYAAIHSVPISNLYAILSKRMPQNTPGNDSTESSQALNEFVMATRRLGAGDSKNPSWIHEINTASPATVEKEIALLLSEINYQLYLNRQAQERQLLTESLMLMLLANQQQPSFEKTDQSNTPESSQ